MFDVHADRDAYVAERIEVHQYPQRRGRIIPRQLPPAVRHFAGRTAEFKELADLINQASDAAGTVVISAIDGTAGIGKTALAVQWAHQQADRFPDGQLYVNLRGFDPIASPMNAIEAVRGFLEALEVPPENIPVAQDAQIGLYRSIITGRRMLVVLDNAATADQVKPLLPGTATCLVLVTSRNRLASLVAGGAHSLTLGLLTCSEATDLLANHLGAERLNTESPRSVAEIIQMCARLPLALAIVAARAAAHPEFELSAIAEQLRGSGDILDAFDVGDPARGLRAILSWSYRQLSSPAARMFQYLGVHPGPDIAKAAAASLMGVSPREADRALAELARTHMVEEHVPGRFEFHDLLRAYACEVVQRLDPVKELPAVLHRLLGYYLNNAHSAARLIDTHRESIQPPPLLPGVIREALTNYEDALGWLIDEHSVLVGVIQQAADGGLDTYTWQLAWAVADFLEYQGYWHELAATQLLSLQAADRLGNLQEQAHANRRIGRAHARLGRYAEADEKLQRALYLFRELGAQSGQADVHLGLARMFELQGRYGEALGHEELALGLFRAAGNRTGEAKALNGVGWFHALLGNFEKTLAFCSPALELLQELGERRTQAETWDSLGYAHQHLGADEMAISCYLRALELTRESGDRYLEAEILTHLGETHRSGGSISNARKAWQDALEIFDELGQADAEQVRANLRRLDELLNEGEGHKP